MNIAISSSGSDSKIWSVNEWGRLDEVILGSPDGAWVPSMNDLSQRSFDRVDREDLPKVHPKAMPRHVVEETLEDLADLTTVLNGMGVVVHRADGLPSMDVVRSPYWQAEPESAINLRDITLIHGDLVIDAPSPTRGRAFETFAVRDVLDQIGSGDHWMVAPPRPRLSDATYDLTRERGINETEPLFDAANCVRMGRDILIDVNNTANKRGARWLQQTLDRHHGKGTVTVHPVSLSPDHIDVVIVPLCDGIALYNPKYVSPSALPPFLSRWSLIPAPEMIPDVYFTGTPKASDWIGMNVLVIDGDERSVIVERRQVPLLRLLEQRGFRPIPVRWRHGRSWGGGFHCISLDVRRQSAL